MREAVRPVRMNNCPRASRHLSEGTRSVLCWRDQVMSSSLLQTGFPGAEGTTQRAAGAAPHRSRAARTPPPSRAPASPHRRAAAGRGRRRTRPAAARQAAGRAQEGQDGGPAPGRRQPHHPEPNKMSVLFKPRPSGRGVLAKPTKQNFHSCWVRPDVARRELCGGCTGIGPGRAGAVRTCGRSRSNSRKKFGKRLGGV